jgi:transposase
MKNHPLSCENKHLMQRILALETQLSEHKSALDDKDKNILEKDLILADKDKAITDKDKAILEKEALISQKSDKISTLEEYIRYMTQQRFGASSEKLSPNQLGLFDEAELLSDDVEAQESHTQVPAHQRKKKRPSIPDHLPVTDIIHDLPEDEKFCPHDKQALRHFSDECSKQLDYIPAKITVLNHIRRKYMCPCCNDYFVTAKKPAQPIEKSIASPGLLSQIVTHKYCDGLPLYRQSQGIFKRLRVELDPSSLANWMIKCGHLVQPLINLAYEQLRANDLLFMDETVLQVLKEEDRSAHQQSRMWVMTNNSERRMVLFHYSPTRETCVADEMLDDFNGALMTDGYAVYDKVAKTKALKHLACWAHARRYFKEASDAQPKGTSGKPEQALAYIQKLFRIEAAMKTATIDDKYQRRQQNTLPILAVMKTWLDKSLKHPVKSAKLTKALTYLNNQWHKLIRYTENGAWPIDNNLAENSIRAFVVGRKNWLFAATAQGAKASANLYSLVETAKANDIEPSAYLKTVFTLLPQAKTVEDVEALLPWNINKVVG